ncbi:N-acetylgalactosamine-N,N'-diacetylbacillosaminyl-diphospho-undecaprenol 4-alpha-N-acetylgalactosaminyltransferase [Corynebacterium comes]|uniref:N-acetylgalactosamine-N, N'-diacetylbacillosaminyl-diphospho-undecaprenol 4-alpha-N-acetylgalactosaminyltransferase n=2 Tax=Corynebacterium comes TaxID=2675218 RepID=A0A6B8W2J8_9CORY|nr:N-acetylgalactosamine-N,N'-diacetylbacillosaminyl-diphospho-undecaprenol 4-alpha-N-acetylgalactosaminyltransferase [Corynebacterium comes]
MKIDLVTGNAKGSYRESVSNKVNLIDFGVSRLLYSMPFLASYLWKNKPGTVLSALDHANIANALLSRLLTPKTKVIVSVHNSLQAGAPTNKMIPRLVNLLNRWVYAHADQVVSVSQGIRDQLLERYRLDPLRVTTIYNPLDIEFISKLSDAPSGNEWLDHSDLPVVMGIGRLTEQKNFELLIRSFSLVNERLPSRLIVLGEGQERERLERIIKELNLEKDVLMPGFVANPFAWLGKCSVFVLSSKWEGLPGVLLEALACGAQVVSTDCKTGPEEILEGGKWGPLVTIGDQHGLADAIIEILECEEPIDTRIRALDFSKERAVVSYFEIITRGDE